MAKILSLFMVSLWAVTASMQDGGQGERSTIPEALARAGVSLTNTTTTPSGSAPSLDDILAGADVIVKGTVARPRSYLSDDQRDVLTDYDVEEPVYLYNRYPFKPNRPSATPPLRVTLRGGTVLVNGLTYTAEHQALPLLQPGTRCLLILTRTDDKFFIAGRYFGAFETNGDRIVALVRKHGFAAELTGVPRATAEAELIARIAKVK